MMEQLINVKQLSLNFNLREPRGNKETNIYAVVKVGKRQIKFSIGLKIKCWLWDKKAQMPVVSGLMTEKDLTLARKVYNVISYIKFDFSKFCLYICTENPTVTPNMVADYFKNNILNTIPNDDMANNGVPNVVRQKSATKALKKALELYPTVKDRVKPSTLETYRHQLKAFLNYCTAKNRDSIKMLSDVEMSDFEIYLRGRNESATKIRNSIRVVRMLVNDVIVKHPYFRNYGIKKLEIDLPQDVRSEDLKVELHDDEIEALKLCEGLTPTQAEYRDLFLLECYTGQRASDLPIFFDKTRYTIIDGYMSFVTLKENTRGKAEMTKDVMEIIDKYKDGFKYVDLHNDNLSAYMTISLKQIANKANLSRMISYTDNKRIARNEPLFKVIGSHFGRHTFITKKVREGVPLDTLKLLTAHKSIQTLSEYYVHLSPQDEVNSIKEEKQRRERESSKSKVEIADEKRDKIKEYKDVLSFYHEPPINYRYIDDPEELLRIIIKKYEIPLQNKGYTTEVLKKIYNSESMEDRKKYEELYKTLEELSNNRENIAVVTSD